MSKYGSCCGANMCSPSVKEAENINDVIAAQSDPAVTGVLKVLACGYVDMARSLFLQLANESDFSSVVKILTSMQRIGEDGLARDFYEYIDDKTPYRVEVDGNGDYRYLW